MQALRDNLAGGVRRQRDEISMDHIQEWAALIGRRNIAYVGFEVAPFSWSVGELG
jgi:hypothetical protein